MKKLSLLLLAATCVLTASAQEKSVDTLVHKAFEALRTNNEEAFVRLFPQRTKMKSLLLSSYGKQLSPREDSMLTEMLGLGDDASYERNMLSKTRRSFQQFLQKGKAAGISFAAYRIDSLEHSLAPAEEGPKISVGTLHISGAGKRYDISFTDVIWSAEENGWYGIEFKKITQAGGAKAPASKTGTKAPAKAPAAKPRTSKAKAS